VPLVYCLNLRDLRAFLVAQNFPINHEEVLYMANPQVAERQKFMSYLTSSIFSVANLVNLID